MPIMTDAAFILPDDFADAALMGRIWRPDLASPSVVAIRQDGVFDITENFPTASQLAEVADPAAALRAARGERVGVLQELLTNTPPDNRDPTKPWLLAPIDLQVIKAAGVTFAVSMLERVIEERARGNPDSAAGHPGRGDAGCRHRPVPIEAGLGRGAACEGRARRSECVEPVPRSGHRAGCRGVHQGSSAVCGGHMYGCGSASESVWNNPEPEAVLAVASDGRIVGASLGNDVNLRDFEGRSALLLSKAKDNNASCAIGPFVRFFDAGFTLDDVRTMEISLEVKGPEGFVLHGASSLTQISATQSTSWRKRSTRNHHIRMALCCSSGRCSLRFRIVRRRGRVHPHGRRLGDCRHVQTWPADQSHASERGLRGLGVRPHRAHRGADAPVFRINRNSS